MMDAAPLYLPLDLPPGVPDIAKGKSIFLEATFLPTGPGAASTSGSSNGSKAPGSASKASGSAAGGFSFAKALHGVKSEEGSSVSARGDGKFADGRDFHVRYGAVIAPRRKASSVAALHAPCRSSTRMCREH